MDNPTAVIIAACITVAGSSLSFFINYVFNFLTNRRAIQQRFYYHVLPERIEFYKELSAAMSKFIYEYPALEFDSPCAFGNFLQELAEQLIYLTNRSAVSASKDVYRYLADLQIVLINSRVSEAGMIFSNNTENAKDAAAKLKKDFLTSCKFFYQQILAQIRVETGQEIIDNECFYLNKKAIIQLRRHYTKNKPQKDNKDTNKNTQH